MDIFGVGPLEILLILLVALVLFGPREIANNARSAGRFLNRLYKSEGWRTMVQASTALRNLPNRLAREAELEQLEQVRRELAEPGLPAPPPAPPDPLQDTQRDAPSGMRSATKRDPLRDAKRDPLRDAKRDPLRDAKRDPGMAAWTTDPLRDAKRDRSDPAPPDKPSGDSGPN
jgi:sec-independent protein translocase protein TatB